MEIKPISFSDQMRMMRGVESIQPVQTPGIEKTGQQDKPSFADFFSQQIQQVNELGLEGDRRVQSAMMGNEPNPHDAVLAMQKAEVSFKLMMSVKDKLEQAYQQILRAQIG